MGRRPGPRKAAPIAVGIAQVEDRDLGLGSGHEGCAIANAFARWHNSPLDDLRLGKGDLRDVAGGLGTGDAAVKREAGANEIEAIVAAEADAGRIGEAHPPCRECRCDSLEAGQLGIVEGVILIGAGEVAHQRVDLEAIGRGQLLGAEAEAVHAGVDHQVAGPAGSDLFPPGDLFNR